ncbi:hypothetical protein MesoLjLc_19360 [Mesorhizobium sp. L-8-10]|uniref:hypothetical protein n=1 Tax=Mesorhizobium sp. L-8-10 TaxID=2744523 RepID=UPI00192802E9|nr:hypothetical protein [Mesorhizobium sp. L-8-10]BCH30006.1 hypothetical protein MesoLjLc_19360 [Mesorhizobium sp. L-8-10]
MTLVAACLFRFAVIVFGYAVAAFAASAFLNLLSLGALDWGQEELPWVVAGSVMVTIPVVALLIGYFAFIPAVPVILLAEMLARRDWLFYAIAGGMVAVVVVGYLWQASGPLSDAGFAGRNHGDPASLDAGFIMMMIGGGVVGGIAYWFAAGRWAGVKPDIAP